jgi:hypothetical protein
MKVRGSSINALKAHDLEASGFWITNPNNSIKGNIASDCQGRGLWNSFANRCFGVSRNSTIIPSLINIKLYEDNIGHSNNLQGIITEFIVTTERGDLAANRYAPPTPFTMSRNVVWKNLEGGYVNRVAMARYLNWVAADNNTRDFQGQTMPGALMKGTLLVSKSLNSSTSFLDSNRIGLSSYHLTLDIEDIVAVNYTFADPKITPNGQFVYGGGVFDTSDMYDKAICLGTLRNKNWRLINSSCGYVTPSPFFDGFPLATIQNKFRYWSLPAIWDTYGYWSGEPDTYLIHDNLFYTYAIPDLKDVPPVGKNGKYTKHRFYGLADICFDNETVVGWGGPSLIPLRLARLNGGLAEVGFHLIGEPSQSIFFAGMRYFSIAKDGIYKLTIPSGRMPVSGFRVAIENAYRTDDSIVLCVPWPGSIPATGRYDSGSDSRTEQQKIIAGLTRLFNTNTSSIQQVIDDTTGTRFYQDTANNCVWMKIKGGMPINVYAYDGKSEESLKRSMYVYIKPK